MARRFGYAGAFDVDMSVDHSEVVMMLDRLVYKKLVETKNIRKVFRKVMAPVRKSVQMAARQSMKQDPRNAWKAVRVITLKKGAGAVVGLLNPFKSGTASSYQSPRGGRSGIRRNREKSDRTRMVEGYQGGDRAWLLRIINQGTVNGERKAGTRGTLKKTANRGTISAKKFFRAAETTLRQAEANLAIELKQIIEQASK